MAFVHELHRNPLDMLQRSLDRLVRDGAAHAAVVVTYPGGRQIVLKSTSAEAAVLQQAANFR